MNLDAGEQHLVGFVQTEQAVVGLELGEQRNLATGHVLGFDLGHGAQAAKVANVLVPDGGGIGGRIVSAGHVAQVLGFDGSAINGFAAGGDTFPIRNKGAGHGVKSLDSVQWPPR
ncbi:hypothetical protein D3C84_883540 [compost metagenome]